MDPMKFCQRLAATTAAEYDCRRCGACCLSPDGGESYVILEPDEDGRMRRLGLPVLSDGEGKACLATRSREGRDGTQCVAFEGTVGYLCGCTIYEDRPGRCRQFEMGSSQCRFARVLVGLPL